MKITTTIASATVAAVLGIAGVSVAGATSNTGSTDPAPSTTAVSAASNVRHPAVRAVRVARRRHLRRKAAELAAKTIGITPAELASEVHAGKTIAQIATEHGVQPQAVIDALHAAGTTKIDAAQAAGKITAARAARLKARLDRVVPRFVNTWHPRHAHAG